jgi:hypothetical protein
MRWAKLIGIVVAGLGVGLVCCFGSNALGVRLRDIRNPMDDWPRQVFVGLVGIGVGMIALGCFVWRGHNWARVVVMAGCVGCIVVDLVGAVLLGIVVANVVDVVFVAGLLVWGVAGPAGLLLVLWQRDVVREFVILL